MHNSGTVSHDLLPRDTWLFALRGQWAPFLMQSTIIHYAYWSFKNCIPFTINFPDLRYVPEQHFPYHQFPFQKKRYSPDCAECFSSMQDIFPFIMILGSRLGDIRDALFWVEICCIFLSAVLPSPRPAGSQTGNMFSNIPMPTCPWQKTLLNWNWNS